MAIKNRPLLDMRGLYEVKPPFRVTENILYTCVKLEKQTALIREGYNVYGIYYKPAGLTEENQKDDLRNDGTICTLYGDNGEVLYIPDTYILRYPNQSLPPYNMFIASLEAGPFRNDYDFDFVSSKLAEVMSDITGVEPKVYIDIVGSNSVFKPEEADALEAARNAKIKNRETTHAQLLKAQSTIDEQNKTIEDLLKLIDDAGLSN